MYDYEDEQEMQEMQAFECLDQFLEYDPRREEF